MKKIWLELKLAHSVLSETFTGENPVAGGTPATEDATDNFTNYVEGSSSNGDYERIEETINSEVNRIRKEIVESPYKIRDIGIQVMVEPPNPEDITSMPDGVEQDIEQILATIIRTSIDEEAGGELTEELLQEKIVVSVQPFNGKASYSGKYTIGYSLVGLCNRWNFTCCNNFISSIFTSL